MATRIYSQLLGTADDHSSALVTILSREPLVSYVVDLLNQLCLKNGVKMSIAFTKPTKEFQEHFEQFFIPILSNVLRYKLYCGFIPWTILKHPTTGELMPMIIPLGSFTWTVRTKDIFAGESSNSFGSKRPRNGIPRGLDLASLNKTKRLTTLVCVNMW